LSDYFVASFYSISQALRFEKMMQNHCIEVKMIPIPRVISSSCGIAARFAPLDADAVVALLLAQEVDAHEVYLFTCEGKKIHTVRVWES